jgi:hypothetical protein
MRYPWWRGFFVSPIQALKMKKNQIEHVVAELPENVNVDALIERLHLLDKIDQAEQQLARGEGISHEAATQRLDRWLK